MADEKEEKLREKFHENLKTARDYMDPLHQKMDHNYEMYRNQWPVKDQDFKVSDLYEYVETVTPILTNNRVRCSVHSDYPDYVRHAQGIQDILDHTYDVNEWDYEAQTVARMAEIYRSAIAYTGYDADAMNGTGKLCVYSINMRWCYLDPAPTKFEDSSFFFYVEPLRLSKVLKMYPNRKEEIEQSVGNKEGAQRSDKNRSTGWFRSWLNTMKTFVTFTSDHTGMNKYGYEQLIPEMDEEDKRKNSVAFIHYWYRDDTDEWRVSYWADEVLLEDEENPFWHGELPYDIYNPTQDILSSMGIPIAEHIENLNWEKNIMMDLLKQNARRTVDPLLMYNTAAGLKEPEKMRQQAREDGMIPVNNPDFVPLDAIADYFTPPPLPNHVIEFPEKLSIMQDKVTGVNDSFRGLSDATSGKEVQLKQEAAYTRIKTKVDNFERFVKSLSEKMIVNAMQYYDEWRAFRIQGDYAKYSDIEGDETPFEVKPIQQGMGEDGEPQYDRNEFFLYANPHEWTQIAKEEADQEHLAHGEGIEVTEDPTYGGTEHEPEPEDISKEDAQEAYKILQMTVEIDTGSSLPTSRMARREEAAALFQMGAIDQEALLESYDWKDRDEILKRMQEAAQQQQQMEQMQQELQRLQQVEQQAMQQQAPPQGVEGGQQPDMATQLDEIRQIVPEVAGMSDEELMQLIAGLGQQPM